MEDSPAPVIDNVDNGAELEDSAPRTKMNPPVQHCSPGEEEPLSDLWDTVSGDSEGTNDGRTDAPPSPEDEEPTVCWICHADIEDEEDESPMSSRRTSPVSSPRHGASPNKTTSKNEILRGACDCVGSLGAVHRNCIDNWVLGQRHTDCGHCKAQYCIQSTYKATSPDMPDGAWTQVWFILATFIQPFTWMLGSSICFAFIRYGLYPYLSGACYHSALVAMGVESATTPITTSPIEPSTATASLGTTDTPGVTAEEEEAITLFYLVTRYSPPGLLIRFIGYLLDSMTPSAILDSLCSDEAFHLYNTIALGLIPIMAVRIAVNNYNKWVSYFEKEQVDGIDNDNVDPDLFNDEEKGSVVNKPTTLAEAEKLAEEMEKKSAKKAERKKKQKEERERNLALAAELDGPVKTSVSKAPRSQPASPNHAQDMAFPVAAAGGRHEDVAPLGNEAPPRFAADAGEQDPEANNRFLEGFTAVEQLMQFAKGMQVLVGVPSTSEARRRWGLEVVVSVLALAIFAVTGGLNLMLIVIAIAVVWRILRTDRPLAQSEQVRRLQIAMDIRKKTTKEKINLMFAIYAFDVAVFSGILPVLMGLTAHYSFSGLATDCDWAQFQPTALNLVCHWFGGAVILITLVRVESTIMMPLFAPGIDFFVLRSIDLDAATNMWSWIHGQVMDLDPLKVLIDFCRVGICELLSIAIAARAPFMLYHQILLPLLNSMFVGEDELVLTSTAAIDATGGAAEQVLADVFDPWTAVALPLVHAENPIMHNLFAFTLIGTVAMFLADYPIRRRCLLLMRPLARIFSKPLFLDQYLFDEEKWAMVGEWVKIPGDQDDLALPPPAMEKMMVRRDRWLELEGYKPRLIRLRLLIFSFCFFSAVGLVLSFFYLSGIHLAREYVATLPELVGFGLVLPLCLLSPKKVLLSAVLLWVSIIYLVFLHSTLPLIESLFNLLCLTRQELCEQAYDLKYLLGRHVTTQLTFKSSQR